LAADALIFASSFSFIVFFFIFFTCSLQKNVKIFETGICSF